MLNTVRSRILPALWPALIGALFSFGLVLPFFSALSLEGMGQASGAILFTTLVCFMAGFAGGGRWKWALYGVCGAVTLGYLSMSGALPQLGGMLSAAVHLVSGNAEPLRMYEREAAVFFSILLTLAGWGMAKQSAGFYPALSLMIIALLAIWFSGNGSSLWLMTPALVALCVLFARAANEDTPYVRVIAASALTVALAFGMTSAVTITSPKLESLAEKIRNYITDTLFFTDPRNVYSIQVDGYKPLESRLGGPANVQEKAVMTVETSKKLLLRGVVFNEYSGLSWWDSLSSRRYLYASVRYRSIRADTMDENRPEEKLSASSLFETIDIKVTMQSGSASTLFVPQRVQDLTTPMALVPYFNASSEIFITRDLEAGDTYTFSAPAINPSDSRLPAILAQAAQSASPRDMSDYLGLHDDIAPDVYILTQSIISGCETPLEKALAIQSYLRSNYTYSLTPSVPPANQDFVSYFLLIEKQGYCTYFASAMAVMGRIAGLPTRYVEGYLAEPSGGVALVSSKQAHAWAEVYFEGFGWVSFDATPSNGSSGSGDDSQQGEGETPGEEEKDDGGEDESEAPQDEGPDATPSPQPAQDSGEDPEDNGDNPQGGADEEPTASPAPDDSAEPEPTSDTQQTSGDSDGEKPKSRWWMWLLLLLLIAAFAVRCWWTRPEITAARMCVNDSERLLLWYRAMIGLLSAAGLGAHPSETPVAHVTRIAGKLPEQCGILSVADAVTSAGYGRYGASPAQVIEARECYERLHKALPLKAKGIWVLGRMLRGIGSVGQVP